MSGRRASASDLVRFTGPELCRRDAHEVVSLLRRREVEPRDLVEASLSRIEAVEPSINAMPTLCPDRARMAALSPPSASPDHPGWLGGLPIGIKDLLPVKGVRTTWGTRALEHHIPDSDDPLVERLGALGGIVMGMTNSPEFGAGGNTFNDVHGATFNPWNTKMNAGGSSGGAAASLATGEVWLSHGSDHGGSLRTPAAYCGIVGLRPTPGRVAGGLSDAAFLIEPVEGPMARCVLDCALFLDAMSGLDARFPGSLPPPDTPFQHAVQEADPRLRIAYAPDLNGFGAVDAEMRDHLNSTISQLERNGADVEELCPDLTSLDRTYHVLRGIMWAAAAKRFAPGVSKHFKPTLAENIAFGQRLTIDDVAEAQLNRTTLFNRMIRLFDDFDVLACPVVGCMPHPQDEEWVKTIDGQDLHGYMDWLRFAFLATATGLPAISVPVGLGASGFPMGLQMIGPPGAEAKLLSAARVLEICCGRLPTPIDPISIEA